MCKAHFRKGGESRRQVRNSESCFAPRRAGKRERPPEALRRSDERRGRALAPPRHKNVPSRSNFPLSPQALASRGNLAAALLRKAARLALVGDRGGFLNPCNIPHPDKRRHSHTCAALRARLRRTRQAAALAAASKRGSAFQAEPRAAPTSHKKCRP